MKNFETLKTEFETRNTQYLRAVKSYKNCKDKTKKELLGMLLEIAYNDQKEADIALQNYKLMNLV